jgi:hypothetical protein
LDKQNFWKVSLVFLEGRSMIPRVDRGKAKKVGGNKMN